MKWKKTDERFVSFFDILGFKDMVMRNSHLEVLEKLEVLKERINKLENTTELPIFKKSNFEVGQTKSVTFSDSIIVFSKSSETFDAEKILYDSYFILKTALENGIAIKGSISFGEVTVDFSNNLFFGQPIIDSYLLHEELEMLGVILDNSAESKMNSMKSDVFDKVLVEYKAHLKSGRITHKVLKPANLSIIKLRLRSLKKLYYTTSGKPRKYIDNTQEFFLSLKKE